MNSHYMNVLFSISDLGRNKWQVLPVLNKFLTSFQLLNGLSLLKVL